MFKLLPSQLPASLILSPSSCPCLSRSSSQKSFLSVFSHSHLWKQGSSLIPRSKGAQSREERFIKAQTAISTFHSASAFPPRQSTLQALLNSHAPAHHFQLLLCWMDVWGVLRLWWIVKNPFHTLSSHTKLTKDIVLLMTSSRGRFNS